MPMLKGKCEKCFEITLQKIGRCKKKKKGLEKKEKKKIEKKDQNQENKSVTIQEMILGPITFKHMLWAYLSFLS